MGCITTNVVNEAQEDSLTPVPIPYSYDMKRHNSFETELLVFGYIRQFEDKHAILSIMQLSQSFFEPLFLWHFRGDELKEFKSKQNGEYFQSELYDLYGAKLKFKLYPKGKKENFNGFVQFQFGVAECSNNIYGFVTYVELFCLETSSEYKKTGVVRKMKYDNLPGWNERTLRSEQIKDCEHLTFGAYFNMLGTKREKDKILNYFRYPKIDIEMKKTWIITDELLSKFKESKWGSVFFSDNFGIDDNFCLVCFPGGYSKRKMENFRLEIRLLTLPHDVNSLRIDFKVATYGDGWQLEDYPTTRHSVLISYNWKSSMQCVSLPIKILKNVKSELVFMVEIKVVGMLKIDDEPIKRSDWHKYTS